MSFFCKFIPSCCRPNVASIDMLESATADIPEFSLDGKKTLAKVVSVYDGDTVKVAMFLGKEIAKFTVRLNGYDCPEMKSKNITEKEYAKAAKTVAERMLLNKLVYIECGKWDKYGRLLAEVYVQESNGKRIHFNSWMISNRLGLPYNGGTKSEFVALYGDVSESYVLSKYEVPNTRSIKDKSLLN